MSQINVNTINPSTGTTVTVTGDFNVSGTTNIRPYKVYSAILSQTGTNAPTAIVLENTIGSISFSYIIPGMYNITSSGQFTFGKTIIYGNSIITSNGESVAYAYIGTNNCQVVTRDANGTSTNDILGYNFVEIRVYP